MLSRIISIKEMIAALRNHDVKMGEYTAYAFLYLLGAAATIYVYVFESLYGFEEVEQMYRPLFLHSVEFALFVIGTLATLWVAYTANKKGDRADFWYRFFPLSFPISIRVIVVSFVFGALLALLGIIDLDYTSYADIVFFVVFYAYEVYLYAQCMSTIAKPDRSSTETPPAQNSEVA